VPWTFGSVPDGKRDVPRYEASNLQLNRLPPVWRDLAPDEAERLRAAVASGSYVPGRLLGTDAKGRDMLARLLAGGIFSLTVGFSSALVAVAIGTLWGSLAGFAGGRVDALLMRTVDVLYGLPSILLVVLLAVAVDGILRRMGGGISEGSSPLLGLALLSVAIGGTSWLTM
jgi:ABC-type dipeptide/oligopeptide/nickel transport system permease subunit